MPRPMNEQQSLEQERAELPGQLAAHQAELDATPPENKARRERLEWQIRRMQKRLAEVEARLGLNRTRFLWTPV
jgi:chromosome segregation ATPase